MQLQIDINDTDLQKKLSQYIAQKQIEASDLLVELLQHFFKKENSPLHYKTRDPEQSATTIDFHLKNDTEYNLFQDVDNVSSYAKELRSNAWR